MSENTKIIEMVKDIKDGKISPILGIRNLVSLAYDYNLEEDDAFISLRGIESQTDHFIIDDKINLSKDYVQRMKDEEKLYLDDIYKICNEILQKYNKEEHEGKSLL